MTKTLLLGGVAALFAFNANALELKPYVGLDYGYVKASTNNINVRGYEVPDNLYENSFNSYIFNIGTKLHKNFGIEAFYQQSSKEKGKTATLVSYIPYEIIDQDKIETSFNAYGVDFHGYVPLNEKFDIIASLGLAEYKFEMKGFGVTEKENKLSYRFGIGFLYDLNKHFSIRTMAKYTIVNTNAVDDMKEISFGIRYNF